MSKIRILGIGKNLLNVKICNVCFSQNFGKFVWNNNEYIKTLNQAIVIKNELIALLEIGDKQQKAFQNLSNSMR